MKTTWSYLSKTYWIIKVSVKNVNHLANKATQILVTDVKHISKQTKKHNTYVLSGKKKKKKPENKFPIFLIPFDFAVLCAKNHSH